MGDSGAVLRLRTRTGWRRPHVWVGLGVHGSGGLELLGQSAPTLPKMNMSSVCRRRLSTCSLIPESPELLPAHTRFTGW